MRDAEMGQGIWTGASMLMAEELDVGLDQVTADFSPANDKLYANPLIGFQATGGSTSMRADWESLRKAAAIARAVLVQAAAQQWAVDPACEPTGTSPSFWCTAARRRAMMCRNGTSPGAWSRFAGAGRLKRRKAGASHHLPEGR